MKQVQQVSIHLLTLPVVGQVVIDVGIEGTVIAEVLDLSFSDFCVSFAADAKLGRDFLVSNFGKCCVFSQQLTERTVKICSMIHF